jgi:hypothetical protein
MGDSRPLTAELYACTLHMFSKALARALFTSDEAKGNFGDFGPGTGVEGRREDRSRPLGEEGEVPVNGSLRSQHCCCNPGEGDCLFPGFSWLFQLVSSGFSAANV